jgi:hypothetical protein
VSLGDPKRVSHSLRVNIALVRVCPAHELQAPCHVPHEADRRRPTETVSRSDEIEIEVPRPITYTDEVHAGANSLDLGPSRRNQGNRLMTADRGEEPGSRTALGQAGSEGQTKNESDWSHEPSTHQAPLSTQRR